MENQNEILSVEKNAKINALSIVGIVLLVIFLPIIIINMTLVIKGWVNPDEVPMLFDTAPLIVLSDSMTIQEDEDGNIISGAFNKNDLIIIKKVDPATLEDGDIITYMTEDKSLVTHRIFSSDIVDGKRVFETVGDYTNALDQDPVYEDQIVGIYTGRVANLGGIAHFLQTPLGIVIVIGIPLIMLLLADMLKKRKENNDANSKNAELEAELALLKAEKAKEQETTDNIEE